MSLNYGGLFEGWELAVAKKIIANHRKEWKCLEREGFDDLLQECLMHWLDVRNNYKPGREASRRTFMAKVVKNKLANIIEKATAEKRKTIYESISLDDSLDDEENSPALKDKVVAADDVPPQVKSELKIELSKAFQKLTPQQQKLCKLLGEDGLSVSEASREMKKHRRHLYREITRIREVFEKEGLKDYL